MIWVKKIASTSMSDNGLCDLEFDIHRVPTTALKIDWFRGLQRGVWDRWSALAMRERWSAMLLA